MESRVLWSRHIIWICLHGEKGKACSQTFGVTINASSRTNWVKVVFINRKSKVQIVYGIQYVKLCFCITLIFNSGHPNPLDTSVYGASYGTPAPFKLGSNKLREPWTLKEYYFKKEKRRRKKFNSAFQRVSKEFHKVVCYS